MVINLTTGGAPTMPVEERMGPAHHFAPELASLNMGSMNFGLYEMLNRFKEFEHDWEYPYLAESDDRIFKNTFRDIAHILDACGSNDTRFELECYDINHLYTAAHFLERGLLKTPLFIQSVFGLRGGIAGHPEDFMHMKRTADRLFGDSYQLVGAGRRSQPDEPGRDVGGDRLERTRRPRGFAVGRARASWRPPTPTRSNAFAPSSRRSACAWPRPTKPAKCWG